MSAVATPTQTIYDVIEDAAAKLYIKALTDIPKDVRVGLKAGRAESESELSVAGAQFEGAFTGAGQGGGGGDEPGGRAQDAVDTVEVASAAAGGVGIGRERVQQLGLQRSGHEASLGPSALPRKRGASGGPGGGKREEREGGESTEGE